MKSFKELIEAYHDRPAPRGNNAALHDLEGVMPGIYSKTGYMKHGHGDETLDKMSHDIIRMAKGNPDMEIPVYKAVMKGEQSRVKRGDWVTPNLAYARSHGDTMGKGHQVISKNVKVKELFSDGTTMHEFGYHPHRGEDAAPATVAKKKTNAIPSAMVSFGTHSLDDVERERIRNKKKKLKTFKESVEDQTIDHLDHSSNPHIGETNDAVHEALHDHYDHSALKDYHKRAIAAYTDASYHLNTKLLKAHREGDAAPEEVDNINVNHMDEALSKHRLPHPLTTYSGVKFEPHKTANEDGLLHLPAYTSSSHAISVARGFGQTFDGENGERVRHIIRFKLPEGHHGFYVGDHSEVPDEREFIMPRGMTVKISKNPEIHDGIASEGNAGLKYHIWDAEPVQHDGSKEEEFEKSDEHFNRMINSNNGKDTKIAMKHYPEKITPEHIDRIVKEGSDSAKRAALDHPSIGPQHITHILNNSKDTETKIKAITHSKATPEHIDDVLNTSFTKHNLATKTAAILSPNATSQNLHTAMNSNISSIKTAALKNKNITPEHIDKALNDKDYDVRVHAASHPKASTENINKALNDDESYVSKAAIHNPNFSENNLAHALANGHTYRAATTMHSEKITPDYISGLIKKAKDPETKESGALSMMMVMKHHRINDDHKRQLLNHPHEDIRGLASTYYGPGKSQSPKD
jgi:hypothetical protein